MASKAESNAGDLSHRRAVTRSHARRCESSNEAVLGERTARRGGLGDGRDAGETKGNGEARGKGDKEETQEYYPDKFHGSFSSQAVGEVVCTFRKKKREIVEEIGLGGLLHLKTNMTHSRALVFWLLRRLDPQKMRILLGGGNEMALTEKSVERVLGIRSSGVELVQAKRAIPDSLKLTLHQTFGTRSPKVLPKGDELRRVLLKEYGEEMSKKDEDKFVVALSAFCCAYMLGPEERSAMVPKNIWEFISVAGNVRNCNWARYVLSIIRKNAQEVKNNMMHGDPFSVRLGGCWLYLEVIKL